ncbi:uncharacterized protein LOC142977494 isoform X2 [Anticarsia gemmatalis]|uniref:uncharacterized protein LOC142977494 isoform X2 n=1 Tax=Anticarsia gemmatalis TaxID=129554 RepID=UPI003F75EFE8
MSAVSFTASFSPHLSNNSRVLALETTLHQGLSNFKELLIDLEQLHIESDNYKTQYLKQKEQCTSKACCGAEELKKDIKSKDNIIQLVASALTRLNETKNWSLLDEVFKILFGDTTHYQENSKSREVLTTNLKQEEFINIKKELGSNEDLSSANESISEIEGTPTGRTSPIIQTKKLKNSMVATVDKKKCPDNWPTPESKALKLTFLTPTRGKTNKLRQSRLNIVKVPTSNVIDITCSPEFSGGSRGKSETECIVQPLIKKESMENDDTILPSPTSGPTNFTLFKSPMKFKKPLSLKTKTDKAGNTVKKAVQDSENKQIKVERDTEEIKKCINNIKMNHSATYTQEDSINILHPERLPKNFLKSSPLKQAHDETTFCDTQASVSLLQHVEKLDDVHQQDKPISPSKRPLADNINFTNVQDDDELQASMSLLQRDAKVSRITTEQVKRRIPEPVEVDYDDGPRTRAEKRLLPGWACEKCVQFFSELYKDDPEMMAKKINECSHHRGVNNPERPKTPPRYWNPRWTVPENTEEFNRRNNV